MTRDRDIELVLEHWLTDGVDEMPDRVYRETFDRVERQSQAAAPRLLRRIPRMNTPLRILASVAAVVLVAVIGYNLLPASTTQVGGPGPTATPSSSPTPSPLALPDGHLEARDYVARALFDDPMTFTITAPEGWVGYGGWAISGPASYSAPDGIGFAFLHGPQVTDTPCDSSGSAPSTAPSSPTVDDVVAALAAREDLVMSGLTDATLAGYSGKRLDLQLPAGLACGQYYVFAEPQGFYAQGPANRWRVWALDVDGEAAVVVLHDYAGTPATDRAAAQTVLDSLRITP